jgi:predicted DNA-binding transcriptional regulator AlpA
MPHHLVGTHEIARMLGVSRQRVQQLVREPDFPQPEVRLGLGGVWQREAVRTWAIARGRTVREDYRTVRED